MKKLIKSVVKNMGYDLVRQGTKDETLPPVYKNFDNLALNYENLFSEKFGAVPKNEKRWDLMKDLLGTPPTEAYFIVKSLFETKDIKGDICEFGVAQGITSQLIANEIQEGSKKLNLFDSFEGLPMPTEKDELKDDIWNLGSMEAYAGTMSNPEFLVKNRLAAIKFPEDRTIIHRGYIEERTKETNKNFPKKVSFAYIDFDFYEPILIALNLLHDVTDSGAILMVDDYDFFSTGVKKAIEEFMEAHPNEYELFVPDNSYGYFCLLTKK